MTALTEFLLARITEDEQAAGEMVENEHLWSNCGEPHNHAIMIFKLGWRMDPARVLAECEAKRRIVAEVFPITADYDPLYVQKVLARVYADHPDFDPAWAVSE